MRDWQCYRHFSALCAYDASQFDWVDGTVATLSCETVVDFHNDHDLQQTDVVPQALGKVLRLSNRRWTGIRINSFQIFTTKSLTPNRLHPWTRDPFTTNDVHV